MQEADLLAMRNFIYTKKPHVICVGGESREAMMIAEDIKAVVGELMAQEQFPMVQVEIIDNELAKVRGTSMTFFIRLFYVLMLAGLCQFEQRRGRLQGVS